MLLCSYEAGKHRESLAPWDSAWFGLSTYSSANTDLAAEDSHLNPASITLLSKQ